MKDGHKCRNIWKSQKGRKKYNIFRFEESHRIKLFHLSSRDLFLTMKFICGTRSDCDGMRKEWKKKKKNHPQSSIPDTVKFILEDLKILRSRGQMPGMLRWSNLMIFMQRACATYVPSISSWIFKLLYDATFFQFFFVGAMASWSRDKNNRIKMELKDV